MDCYYYTGCKHVSRPTGSAKVLYSRLYYIMQGGEVGATGVALGAGTCRGVVGGRSNSNNNVGQVRSRAESAGGHMYSRCRAWTRMRVMMKMAGCRGTCRMLGPRNLLRVATCKAGKIGSCRLQVQTPHVGHEPMFRSFQGAKLNSSMIHLIIDHLRHPIFVRHHF